MANYPLVFVGTQLVNLRNLGSTVDGSEIQSPVEVGRVCNLQKQNDCKTCTSSISSPLETLPPGNFQVNTPGVARTTPELSPP